MRRFRVRAGAGLVSALALTTSGLLAQQSGPQGAGAKQATAVRVPDGSIQLDGRLNEDAWSRAAPIVDFVQKEPTEGAPPTERMEVRLIYEANAL